MFPRPKEYELKQSFDLDVGLSDAIQELWKLDVNRLNPNADYTINVQEGKKPYCKENAEEQLFTSVAKEALQRPTYKAFVALLDNYTGHTGSEETVTNVERREIDVFLKSILQTAPMQYCHKYLCKHGDNIPSSISEFQELLYKIWFELYRREETSDSSGFEHGKFVCRGDEHRVLEPFLTSISLFPSVQCLWAKSRMIRSAECTTGSAFT